MHAVHQESNEEPLSYDEVLIVKVLCACFKVPLMSSWCVCVFQSALEMRDKTVQDAMTPLESVYMLDIAGCINRKLLKEVN